jgi:YD repeat-containing protein
MRGNVTAIKNQAGIERKFWYDSSNRLIASVDGIGRAQIYQYDEKGRLNHFFPCGFVKSAHLTSDQTTFEYFITEAMEYEYDPEINAVSAIKKGNELLKRILHDSEGRIAEISDAYGYKVERSYDERSRLKTCRDLDGGFEYDYNERDQVVKVLSPAGCVGYEYDEVGNLIKIKDGNGNETCLEYDENYNLTAVIDAEGGVTRYGYNNLHCLTYMLFPNGFLKEITYDNQNRPVREIIGR